MEKENLNVNNSGNIDAVYETNLPLHEDLDNLEESLNYNPQRDGPEPDIPLFTISDNPKSSIFDYVVPFVGSAPLNHINLEGGVLSSKDEASEYSWSNPETIMQLYESNSNAFRNESIETFKSQDNFNIENAENQHSGKNLGFQEEGAPSSVRENPQYCCKEPKSMMSIDESNSNLSTNETEPFRGQINFITEDAEDQSPGETSGFQADLREAINIYQSADGAILGFSQIELDALERLFLQNICNFLTAEKRLRTQNLFGEKFFKSTQTHTQKKILTKMTSLRMRLRSSLSISFKN